MQAAANGQVDSSTYLPTAPALILYALHGWPGYSKLLARDRKGKLLGRLAEL